MFSKHKPALCALSVIAKPTKPLVRFHLQSSSLSNTKIFDDFHLQKPLLLRPHTHTHKTLLISNKKSKSFYIERNTKWIRRRPYQCGCKDAISQSGLYLSAVCKQSNIALWTSRSRCKWTATRCSTIWDKTIPHLYFEYVWGYGGIWENRRRDMKRMAGGKRGVMVYQFFKWNSAPSMHIEVGNWRCHCAQRIESLTLLGFGIKFQFRRHYMLLDLGNRRKLKTRVYISFLFWCM